MKMRKMASQLCYDHSFDCWALWLQQEGNHDQSFCMLVDHSFQGDSVKDADSIDSWFRYRFLVWDAGDYRYIVTRQEYQERLQSIADHEGDEAAALWHNEQDYVEIVNDDHPVFALRKHWEAMMELGLFTPSITISAFRNMRGMNDELREKMNAVSYAFHPIPADEAVDTETYG